MEIDSERVKFAAILYNNVHDMLTEHGWAEDMGKDPFWPLGKPTGSWRHSQHPGSWSMVTALVALVQTLPKRA